MLYFAVVKGLEGAFLQRALQGPQPGTKKTPNDTHPVEINDTNDFVSDLNWMERTQERNDYCASLTKHPTPIIPPPLKKRFVVLSLCYCVIAALTIEGNR